MVEFFQGPKVTRYKAKVVWSVHDKNLKREILKLFREGRTTIVIEEKWEDDDGWWQTLRGYFPLKYRVNEGEGSGRRRLHPIQLR